MARKSSPIWRNWEVETKPHFSKRMTDREFTESDVREMLKRATHWDRDVVEGRWILKSKIGRTNWEMIVEPDRSSKRLVLITAYRPEVD